MNLKNLTILFSLIFIVDVYAQKNPPIPQKINQETNVHASNIEETILMDEEVLYSEDLPETPKKSVEYLEEFDDDNDLMQEYENMQKITDKTQG